MVTMLAIGPKIRRFKNSRSSGFSRVIQISSTPSFGGEVELSPPCCKILQHVKKSLPSMNKDISKAKFIIFFRYLLI
jgi:hypothetical protein